MIQNQRLGTFLKWSAPLIILLGICLRVLKGWYFTPLLGQDEASIYLSSLSNSFLEHFLRLGHYKYAHYSSPPLFFWFSKIWTQFADNIYLLRTPTLIFSFLTLWLVWKFTNCVTFMKRQEDNELLKLLILFFVSTSLFFIYYGVIFRTYSLGICLAAGTLYFFSFLFNKTQNSSKITFYPKLGFVLFLLTGLLVNYGMLWMLPG